MSWGERSCKECNAPKGYRGIEMCNVDCPSYEWDGLTESDSIKRDQLARTKGLSGLLPALFGVGAHYAGVTLARKVKKRERRVKKCLVCGIQHTHNNSFCSAGCCKQYKSGNITPPSYATPNFPNAGKGGK